MPEPSGNTKHGQEASTKRARAALENQDARRPRRPLEGAAARAEERSGTATDHQVANEPHVTAPTAGETFVEGNQSRDIAALLTRYGIKTVPNVSYEWGGYRYSNPTDAIAAAKRAGSA